VNYISTSIRADVQQVNQTVTAVNRRLLEAVKKAEDRMDEFNALLEVAQEEAESAFISTASTLRGISSGAAALAGRKGSRRGPRRARKRQRDSDLREGWRNCGTRSMRTCTKRWRRWDRHLMILSTRRN
jgi:hypothetical protein